MSILLNILFITIFLYGVFIRLLTLLLPTAGQKGWNVIAWILSGLNVAHYKVSKQPFATFRHMSDYVERLKEHEKQDIVFHFLKQIIRFSTEDTLERYFQSAYNAGQLAANLLIFAGRF